jgi:LAO/AO transport system kinase
VSARAKLEEFEAGVIAGDRAWLGRAITLVESRRPDDREMAAELLSRLAPRTGTAHRVGISGVPGAGKSTFIEALGTQLTDQGHRVAVLSVDPSSSRSGGSILGDKTRMQELARNEKAFVRPSPSAGSLGGVARNTREAMLLCEAAGYDVVLVETVGVGQSEVMVAEMVDFFLVLMIAGAGDELQGIKRGILEVADMLAVNKADGDNLVRAELARAEYMRALKLMQPKTPFWTAKCVTCSGLTGEGLPELWASIVEHRDALEAGGAWEAQREEQRVRAMWRSFEQNAVEALRTQPEVAAALAQVEARVQSGDLAPERAALELLRAAGLSGE